MAKVTQEEKERFYLKAFLNCFDFKFFELRRGSNPPDFILVQEGLSITIEITDFHSSYRNSRGFTRRLVEEEWKKLQALIAQARESETDLAEISCWLRFKELVLPQSKEYPAFVEELLRFVKNNLSKPAGVPRL